MIPKKIKRTSPPGLSIEWDDGHQGKHSLAGLRRYCPCASCAIEAEESGLLPILVPGKTELKSIDTVGSYALQLRWGDGHSSGIYTYDYLRQICECDLCKEFTSE